MKAIFSSNCTLKFQDKAIENEFKAYTYDCLKYFNGFHSIVVLVSATCSVGVIADYFKSFEPQGKDKDIVTLYWALYYTSIITLLLSSLIVLTCYLCKKIFIIQKIVCYSNCLLSFFSITPVRVYFLVLLKYDPAIFYFFHFFEFFIRTLTICFGMIGFIEALLLSSSQLIMFLVFYSPMSPWWAINPYSLIFYAVFQIITIIIGYFFTKESKKSFWFKHQINKDLKWFENVFETFSSGFIKITDNKIVFINRKIIEHLKEHSNVKQIYKEGNLKNDIEITKTNSDHIITELLININSNYKYPFRHNEDSAVHTSSIHDILSNYKSHYIEKNEVNFIFLGTKSLSRVSELSNEIEEENDVLMFDVYFRYYSDPCDNFEFLFNDVTRTRQIEKKNAELKYQSVFLSKIAHEFKNPLICISELIDKSKESYEIIKNRVQVNVKSMTDLGEESEMFEKNLFLIKALSNYLVILIKDLDYFSEAQIHGKNRIILNKINLDELINFVSEVAKGIILKNGKNKNIQFLTSKDVNLPVSIFSDEVRLKQILINLASNAIKFTTNGKIILEFRIERNYLRISITDTGIGISEEFQKKMFKPFFSDKSISENLLGAGLGMGIVHDITSKLGSTIQFMSHVGKGSRFWFFIPLFHQVTGLPIVSEQEYYNELTALKMLSSSCQKENENENENAREIIIKEEQREDIPLDIEHSTETIKLKVNSMRLCHAFEHQRMKSSQPSLKSTDNQSKILQCDINNLNLVNNLFSFPLQNQNWKNIIIADDESIVRQSTMRIFKRVLRDKSLHFNILEAEDGIDILFYIRKLQECEGKISGIISDETMKFCHGSEILGWIRKLRQDNKILHIPFFIVSAYEASAMNKPACEGLYSKPLTYSDAEAIIAKISL